MQDVTVDEWWKAREIPLIDADWRNIQHYCEQEKDPFDWDRCIYLVRLAPPFAIVYGDDRQLLSPLLYIGSGKIRDRWTSHREWLFELGQAIPGGRYEVWVVKPRCQKTDAFYKDIEADILTMFREKTGCLPLRNLKVEGTLRKHTYDPGFFDEIVKSDCRYLWAIYPTRGHINEYFKKGRGING